MASKKNVLTEDAILVAVVYTDQKQCMLVSEGTTVGFWTVPNEAETLTTEGIECLKSGLSLSVGLDQIREYVEEHGLKIEVPAKKTPRKKAPAKKATRTRSTAAPKAPAKKAAAPAGGVRKRIARKK